MTENQLQEHEILDLYDMLVKTMNDLFELENSPKNYAIIREKKEHVLLLQNAIALKRLEM